jgi:hypothetical protein
VPGLRSSRIHILDIKPDPRNPSIVKVIEPEEISTRTGYSRPHTVHCGPEGVYVSALGAPDGNGPAGIFLLDHLTFEVLGKWEMDRGPQYLGYDFWWHITQDTLLTSEWGTPRQVENGVVPEDLLQSGTAIRCTFGICARGVMSRRLIWAKSTRWSSKCGLRMIRRRPMDLRVWSSRSRISAPRFGSGTDKTDHGKYRKSLKFPPSRLIPKSSPHCVKASKQCLLWSPFRTVIGDMILIS